ncbi:hypothetical protein KAR91_25170 [Candidatus Pacearchaeota archaeon]|nr:hypothetical protein [Candidatus Pacearchaeota archaeon]
MADCESDVNPDQAWSEDGTANVTPKTSCDVSGERNIPLKHFPPQKEIHIIKAEYPSGLVIVPTEGYPHISPAPLPTKIGSGDMIIFRPQDWPEGGVGWFEE